MKAVFEDIYKNKKWFGGSGAGSLPENTIPYRNFLQDFLKRNNIKSVLDFGCGDWQFSKLIDWTGVSYLGLDLVTSVIETNKKLYERDGIRFGTMESTVNDLPKADLIIIKDVFQHWPNKQIEGFKQKILGFTHNLITNTYETYDVSDPKKPILLHESVNVDIDVGNYRPLDLKQSPFLWNIKEVFQYRSPRKHVLKEEVKKVVTLLV